MGIRKCTLGRSGNGNAEKAFRRPRLLNEPGVDPASRGMACQIEDASAVRWFRLLLVSEQLVYRSTSKGEKSDGAPCAVDIPRFDKHVVEIVSPVFNVAWVLWP